MLPRRIRFGRVLEKAFGRAQIGSSVGVAKATEGRLEVVGWHESAPKMREDVRAKVRDGREFKMRKRDRCFLVA